MEKPPKVANILVYIMKLPEGTVESIRKYEKATGNKYRILLLWDTRIKDESNRKADLEVDYLVECDFGKQCDCVIVFKPITFY